MIRFEILLPLFYNDGRPIEPEKFLATDDEFVNAFGATSTDPVTVRGQWKYQSTVYSDQLIRVRVDVEDTEENQRRNACSQGNSKGSIRATRHLDHGPSD